MQDMIRRIIEADNEARKLDEKNKRAAEKQKREIEKKSQQMYDEYIERTMETVSKNDALEKQKAEKLWKEISNKQQSTMIKLKSDFENNCERWTDEIVARVIGN